ncbi:MAG: LysE family translocator [Gaiellales bacterium]
MIDPGRLWLFVGAAVALAVIPGPAVLYIVAQSINGGRSAGLVSALGVASGGLVHVLFAIAGLSAILVASATAFTIVKLAGALYLIWLGLVTLFRRGEEQIGGYVPQRGLGRIYRRGVVVNVLNPKTAIFFLAFLPQFVDTEQAVRPQLALLGLVFVVIALSSDMLWATIAGAAASLLRDNRRFLRIQRRVSGGIFIGLGVVTAFAGSDR